ncbi:glutathione-dependent disulfide-bond oxidoreductase [Psychromarinibacter sp. C21-152]|uniref:Glutathione-dependent disulfide-bond oxidoreductase n=1 Tax=Psychromarinibacter sediminicola TaxID=3033385 RepID=A0AAE3NRG2_9RHOB|nr:glutathione-dependent disulfide-bond oxidoreductase [Psychromarinibacter sediminicola]MDF0600299.1 glutathione-dependent disulfide-bond oxidoreductase [Psychromarinibacter sediminicola]
MSTDEYDPPRVWTWDSENGGQFSKTNRPVAGPTHDAELPVGRHPYQLYSLATPNGQKVTILFEELLEAGHDAEYDAWPIRIGEGEQFGSGFVAANPNSKIPALMDHTTNPPTRVFESAAILMHLSERFGAFQVSDPAHRPEMLSWLFWQMGSAPYVGGGFGHFYAYAPKKWQYPIDRFAMETKRQLDVLNRHLADRDWMAGGEYTIADIAIWPWYAGLVLFDQYKAAEFLDVKSYTNVVDWAERIWDRPAVKRGRMVNRLNGDPSQQLHERHSASDFEHRTQDKIAAE